MKTPTILKISLKPFCPACGGGLEMQEDTRMVHDIDTDELLGFALLCPWCGNTLMTSEVGWQERKKEELIQVIKTMRGSPPILDPDELEEINA